MPPQPDRHPGIREEEEIKLNSVSSITQSNGHFGYKTDVGFSFYQEGSERILGLLENEHLVLDTLIHHIIEDCHIQLTRTSGKITNITYWTDSGETTKIREINITRTSGKVSQIEVIQYDEGVENVTFTINVVRVDGKIDHFDCIKVES